MDFIPDAPSIQVDDTGAIAVDHECKRCGYNLRGLREDGRCPECGTPVGLSTRGNLLRFADPNWVDKIALGLKIILWMILVGIVVGIIASVLGGPLGSILQFGAAAVSFYGVWLMTEPDPSGIGEDPNITARKVVRVTLVIGLAGTLLQLIGGQSSPGMTLMIVALIAGLIGLVGEFAKFFYYEQLALRIPNDAMVTRARFLKWAYPITMGVVLIVGVVSLLTIVPRAAAGASPGAALGVIGCLAIPGAIALIVFGVMTLVLLFQLRKSIAEQARLARESWAAS